MKKTIAILLVMAIALTSVFAAEKNSVLNLATTVDNDYDIKIADGDVTDWNAGAISGNQTVGEVKHTYTALVRTNEVGNGELSLVASTLASQENGVTAYVAYEVSIGNNTVAIGATNSPKQVLISSSTDVGSGKRTLAQSFDVKLATAKPEGNDVYLLADAPAGSYTGTITVTYTGK